MDHVATSRTVNVWDDGVEGNYWSDFQVTDNDGNGIGDKAYLIAYNNQDEYPLISPVDIATVPEFPSWIILPLFLVTSLVVIIFKTRVSKSFVSTQNGKYRVKKPFKTKNHILGAD